MVMMKLKIPSITSLGPKAERFTNRKSIFSGNLSKFMNRGFTRISMKLSTTSTKFSFQTFKKLIKVFKNRRVQTIKISSNRRVSISKVKVSEKISIIKFIN
jgi:hypothetical protein